MAPWDPRYEKSFVRVSLPYIAGIWGGTGKVATNSLARENGMSDGCGRKVWTPMLGSGQPRELFASAEWHTHALVPRNYRVATSLERWRHSSFGPANPACL